jgi:SAM-dependent methyltransferase
MDVTLLDSSPTMRELAEWTIVEAAVRDNVTVKDGDSSRSAHISETGSFDSIVCHNLLEYLDDPAAAVAVFVRARLHFRSRFLSAAGSTSRESIV